MLFTKVTRCSLWFTPTIISFSLYLALLPSFNWWDKLTKLNQSFCRALLITSLILKSFFNKPVSFNYTSFLMEGIYIMPVAAAHTDSIVAEFLNCHIWHHVVPVVPGWSGRFLLLLHKTDIMSYTSIVIFKLPHKKRKYCKVVFHYSDS